MELIYYDVNTKYDVCERQCLTCGYKQIDRYREHQHYYTDDWSSGSTTHWKVCYYCKEVNQDTVANHTFGDWTETKPATTTEEGLKERTCSVCEYTQEETIPVHTHDVHDKAWKYDDTNHWQECSCGEKLNVANHIYGDWRETKPATETEAGSRERDCTVCDYVQTETIPMLEHEHSYGDWQKDETQHWKECRCGEKTEVGNHTFDDWTITKEPPQPKQVPENAPAPSANIRRQRRCRFIRTMFTIKHGNMTKPSTGRNAPAVKSSMWQTILRRLESNQRGHRDRSGLQGARLYGL